MGKRSNLYEIYFGPLGGYGSIGNKLKNGPRGSMHSTGDPLQLDAEWEDESDENDLSDEPDISTKIGLSKAVVPTDTASRNPQNTSYDNIGYAYPMVSSLTEKAVQHTNTIMKGSGPNLTYRNSKGGKVTKTTMGSTTHPKLYTAPRRDMIATQYGTSRAPLPRHNDMDSNNIWSLDQMLDKYELSLHKHNRNINRINKVINEVNLNFF